MPRFRSYCGAQAKVVADAVRSVWVQSCAVWILEIVRGEVGFEDAVEFGDDQGLRNAQA